MNESDCLSRMVPPSRERKWSYRNGVVQILVTHSCDLSCYGCTQGSNLRHTKWNMTPEQFSLAVDSLKGYFGVYGLFGGNPAVSPYFMDYCAILREKVPFSQCGIWCNNPIKVENAMEMRATFDPSVSNLNCHMSAEAYMMFKQGWPESRPFGHNRDSRHSPPWIGMKDVDALPVFNVQHQKIGEMENTEENRHTLIADCDINKSWSASIGVFRGELRAWFCEIAMAQAIHHQREEDYPDTGMFLFPMGEEFGPWWKQPMTSFRDQVRKHCHECGVPLRGYGELAVGHDIGKEQTTKSHIAVFRPKKNTRAVELVTALDQVNSGKLDHVNHYIQNSSR